MSRRDRLPGAERLARDIGILRALVAGLDGVAVADRFGVGAGELAKILQRNGWPPRPKKALDRAVWAEECRRSIPEAQS